MRRSEKQITKLKDRNENLTAMIKDYSELIRSYQASIKTAVMVLDVQRQLIADKNGGIWCNPHIEKGNGLAIKALQDGHEAVSEEYFDYQKKAGVE